MCTHFWRRSRPVVARGLHPGSLRPQANYVRSAATGAPGRLCSSIVTHPVIQELDMDYPPVGVTRGPDDAAPVESDTSATTGGRAPRLLAVHRLSRCDLPCRAASLNSGNHCHGSTPLLGPEPLESDEAGTV